jgi:hypothetical protein
MRGRKLLAVLAGVSLLLGGIGVFTALATTPSGNQEADFNFGASLVGGRTVAGPDFDAGTSLAPVTAFSHSSTIRAICRTVMRLATILLGEPHLSPMLSARPM